MAIIVVLVIGGPLALRWRGFAWIHLVVATAVATVFVVGADCPLTTWHKHFLSLARRPVYAGGFVEHYLVEPVTGGGMTTGLKMIVLGTWVLPTIVSYTILWRRHMNNTLNPADASAVMRATAPQPDHEGRRLLARAGVAPSTDGAPQPGEVARTTTAC